MRNTACLNSRIPFDYDPLKTTFSLFRDLMCKARDRGLEHQVAYHLMGARLQMRLPDAIVKNEPFSTAYGHDKFGGYVAGDTVFHVSKSLWGEDIEKCIGFHKQGFDVYLIVPDRYLAGAREILRDFPRGDSITLSSVESFVSMSMDFSTSFSDENLPAEFKTLLETYNERVEEVESDKSLLIEIP